MKISKLLLTAAVLSFGLLTQAQDQATDADSISHNDADFKCITQEQAQKYIRDFKIDKASFGGVELCNADVDFKKLMNDMQIVEKGQFAKGDNLFIKGYVGPDYYSWAKTQTYGIERGQDMPAATAYNSGGYFTMQDGWAKASTLGRVGTFIHEARHTAGYRHYPCQQGSYQGSSMAGCDSSYSQGGSHAVEMEYYARVTVQGTNFHPVYKKMARLMAIARANFMFNTPVIQRKETLMALTQDRSQALLLVDNQWVPREAPQTQGELKRTSFGAVIFDHVKAYAIELYENSGFKDLVLDTYSYFKILLEAPATVKDFEEYDLGTQRYISKVSSTQKFTSFDFPNGQWGREASLNFNFVKFSTQILESNTQGLYLIKDDGSVAQYNPQQNKITDLPQAKWNFDYKRVVNLGSTKLALKTNGQVVQIDSQKQEKPWAGLSQAVDDLAVVPVYDAFTIVK